MAVGTVLSSSQYLDSLYIDTPKIDYFAAAFIYGRAAYLLSSFLYGRLFPEHPY